jgi:hypothetical protein
VEYSLLALAGITCYSFHAVCISGNRIGLSASRAQECAQPYLHSGNAPYYTGMAWKGESLFCPDRKAWNAGCQCWPDLNGLDRQMSVLTCLEWLGMSEVDFGPTGMAWNRGSRFWHDWNGLERRK